MAQPRTALVTASSICWRGDEALPRPRPGPLRAARDKRYLTGRTITKGDGGEYWRLRSGNIDSLLCYPDHTPLIQLHTLSSVAASPRSSCISVDASTSPTHLIMSNVGSPAANTGSEVTGEVNYKFCQEWCAPMVLLRAITDTAQLEFTVSQGGRSNTKIDIRLQSMSSRRRG